MEQRTSLYNTTQGKRDILSTKPGTKRFMFVRVNDEKDVFQELWGRQNFENVMHFTLAEVRREGDEAFSLSKNEFTAFFGLCMLHGALKGRDKSLGMKNIGVLSFEKL